MASSDIKYDYNMEAGLLSTHEERMLTKEAQFQDSELANSRDDTRTTSCARRALIALAVVCLVGVGLVSLGGGVCPGHLRHAVNGEISVKDAIHSHKPNLSDSMAQLARRQDNLTPGASSNTGSGESSTDAATEPTAGPTDASTTDQPSDTAAQATSTQPEASQTSDTNQPSSTAAQESTSQEASTSSEDTPSSTEQPSSDAATTSNGPSSTAAETTAESRSSSQAESTTDSDDQASSTTSDSSEERTITTGTRTTSSAVQRTFTATLENGGITTLTSTSWVAVVPNSQSTSASDASLQNAASQSSVSGILSAVISMMFGGLLLL